MKKITFFISLMITSLGFAQQVVVQNFETPASYTINGFEGLGSATIVADPAAGGTNMNGLKLVSVATGNPWQGATVEQLTTKLKLTTDKTVKVDVYSTQTFKMLAKVEIGGAAAATAQTYTTPGVWQTLTFTFTDALDGTAVANGEYSKISFFPNWNGNFGTPATNFTVYVDNITAVPAVAVPDPAPTTAAPTPPARNAWDVISLFSDAYTSFTINDWSAGFGWGGGSPITDVMIATNPTKKIVFANFIGVDFGAGNHQDTTNMTNFHMDFWIPGNTDLTGKVLNPKFSVWTSDTSGETSSFMLTYLPTVNGSWASIDAPISTFTAGDSNPNIRNNVAQFLITSNLGVVYIDNIYLYRAPTMSNTSFATSTVNMFPNPTSDNVTITAKSIIESVSVYNVLGQEVMTTSPKADSVTINISDFQSGVYLVKSTVDGTTSTSRIIKK